VISLFEAEMMRTNLKEYKIEDEALDFLPSLQYKTRECGGEGNCLILSIYYLLGSPKKVVTSNSGKLHVIIFRNTLKTLLEFWSMRMILRNISRK